MTESLERMELEDNATHQGIPSMNQNYHGSYLHDQPQDDRKFSASSAVSALSAPAAKYSPREPAFPSPFPAIPNRSPNVPPTEREKEKTLEDARQHILASNDSNVQLVWAQDALTYVEIAAQDRARDAGDGSRPVTPTIERGIREDAVNITKFLADQEHPHALFMRGTWLEFGKFHTRKDLRESYRCYTKAVQRGHARAEYRIGMQFESSREVQKAVQHYNQGLQMGDGASSYVS